MSLQGPNWRTVNTRFAEAYLQNLAVFTFSIIFPHRYDLVDGRWIYKHDGHVFQERLAEELEDITGKENIDLDQAPQVGKGFVGYGADPT